jgi:hypothetical protein
VNKAVIIAGALLSGGLAALAGLGLGAATARADVCSISNQPPACAPPEGPAGCYDSGICSQEWCPNQAPMLRMPNWDMNVCHTYYFAPNSGAPALMVEGQPPGSPLPPNTGVCPPLAWMCP